MTPAIRTDRLCKEFILYDRGTGIRGALRTLFSRAHRVVRAVDDLTVEIQRGELVGLIGSNGAGKSTTIKMLTGILHPSSGDVLVNGLVPHRGRRQLAKDIGVVFGQRTQLWWDLPLMESFRLLRWIYGVPRDRFTANLNRLVDLLRMGEFLDMPVRMLSLGQRMRGDLAASLLHDPTLLFLDEPTIGLDVEIRDTILEFIKFLNRERGVTVLMTTHDLLNLEKVSQRILVIERGRLIFNDTVKALKNHAGRTRRAVAQFEQPLDGKTVRLDGAAVEVRGHTVTIDFDLATMPMHEVLSKLQRFGPVADVSISEPSIETIVKRLMAAPLAPSKRTNR